MSGVTPLIDTLLATRLAQRVDLVPLKGALEIAGPDAVTSVEKVTNDVRLPSRAALQRQLGVGLHDGGDSRNNTSASARSGETVTLSAVARAVSAILDPQSGPMPKILGSKPLWPHLQPPAAQALTAALARTVAHSGLFYESHLQQYAAGSRSLAQLGQEPQARLGPMEKTPLDLPGARVAGQDPGLLAMVRMAQAPALSAAADGSSEASAEARLVVRPGAADTAATIHSGQADAAPASSPWPVGLASRLDPANLAAIYGLASARDHELLDDMAGQESTATKPDASPLDAVRGNTPVPPGIHPDALALVRQQLELLAVPVFRWGGEAWPGVPMDWKIHQEPDERPAADDSEAVPATWSTRLSITLPTLKAVEVRVSLAGSTLQVHLAASENATVALLGEGRNELPKRLAALGLQLSGVQVGVLAPAPAAPTPGKDDDAAHRA